MKKLRHWLFLLAALTCSMSQTYATNITLENWTSSNHGGGSTDSKTYTFTLEQPTLLTFYWEVSSETNYDWLTVTLNGNQILRESGFRSGYSTHLCSSGDNKLVVSYTKDGGGDNGSDQASIFNIKILESSNESITLLPYGQETHQPWEAKYFMVPIGEGTTPGENWYATDFDDSSWENIAGPISNRDAQYHATAWEPENSTYWVRRHFTLDSIPENILLALQVIHDDGCQIYLNGNQIYNSSNVISSTNTIRLSAEQSAYLREGDNVIAATVSNSGGSDAYMDFGINTYTYNNGIVYVGTTATEIIDKSLTEYVIKEGTTVINPQLFYDANNLQNITLPNSIKVIGDNAFYSCDNLKSITIPDSVEYIGSGAFNYCFALDSVTFNAINCISTSNNIFDNCSNLKTVFIGDEVERIPNNLLYDDNVQKVVIGEKVAAIGDNAFYSCSNLTDINIPNSVNTIGNNAFYECNSLPVENYVRYADSYAIKLTDKNQTTYTLKENTRFLGSSLFSGCTSMTSVNIPSGIKELGDNTFYNCQSLSSLTLPDGVTSIGNYAFYNCRALASINIPSGVTAIGNYTFYDCNALRELTLPDGITTIGEYAFYSSENLQTLTLPETVTSIGQQAFYQCNALSAINIPSGVTAIGYRTFYDCNALRELTLPDGITTIDEQAFYSCGALQNLNIPATVTTIGNQAFKECIVLRNITLPEGLTSIGQEAFYNCEALTDIKILSSITSLPYRTFYSCDRLLHIEFPATIETIGSGNLYNSNLTIVCNASTPPTIEGGCSSKIIYVPAGSGAAYRELYPDNIIIDGEGVTVQVNITEPGTLGEEAIKQAEYLYNINNLIVSGTLNNTDIESIRNSMTSLVSIDMSGVNMDMIPSSFFENNKRLSKVILPNNLTKIGSYAFRYCSRLKEITLPNTLQDIYSYAFYESGLDSIVLPDNVTTIGSYTFYNCDYLQSINIPNKVKRIEEHTFYSCNMLQNVAFTDSLTYIGNRAFRECTSLPSIALPNSVTQIDNEAFYECSSLKTITFPLQLNHLGNHAFRNCFVLEAIDLPSGLASLGEYVFTNCDKLQSVTLPNVTTIGQRTFESCDNLKEVTLPTTLDRCGNYIFSGCNQLESVTCQALFPPITTYIAPHDACVLYAPEWTLEKYKLANGWSGFKLAEPIPGVYPGDITLYKEEALSIPDAGLPEGYKPTLKLAYDNNYNIGKLTIRGEMPFTLSLFEMEQTRSTSTMTSLINRGNVSADSVMTKITMAANTWHYLTFPYDVKVSDIITEGGDWIICYYDGEARAQADFGNTWKTVPFDSILHAGEGYIWHSNKSNFVVPAMANNNRNLIFAKEARYIQLREHAASTTANYGWNLIGNPYPSYYDTRFMEFSSPITVRNGNSYAAYSPLDDSYILMPNEAFFVQCSADNNVAGFTLDGRQTNNTVRNITEAPSKSRGTASDRSVLNLYLENNSFVDHTRLVVNEKASMEYEISCDASKFMSDDNTVPQLFTIENNERMAINERPLADGKAALGVYIGVAGTHTFSLDTKSNDTEVVLIDKVTGVETDLTIDSYTFSAEAGTYTDRFEIRMKRTGETSITEATATEVKVAAESGAITIVNATETIYVYNAAGALVATVNEKAATIEVAPGIYVVKVGEKAHKVSVVK